MTVEGSNFPPPASAASLAALEHALPQGTPVDYFAFMETADGCQVWFDADGPTGFDCIRIYCVSLMLKLRASHESLFPSLVVIGGDQGSQVIGYDTSASDPWPLVVLLPGSGTSAVALSFTDLAHRYFRASGVAVET